MSSIFFEFTWPDKSLSPNARLHYQAKAQHVSAARSAARLVALCNAERLTLPPTGALETTLTFFPPDSRKRDIDNLLSSMKSTLDGIFDALETNDNRVRRTVLEWGAVYKHGRVIISIKPFENNQ